MSMNIVNPYGARPADATIGTQRVYKECTFPDMSFANVPKTATAVAIATLRTELSKIYPDSERVPWFAKWALWWEHTEPVSEPTESRSARLASNVWVLLRVRAQDRRDIIKCLWQLGVFIPQGRD